MDPLAQTVEVRVFSSDEEMNSAMQKKVEEIYADILTSAPVAEAHAAYEAAQQNVAKLKKAQASLSGRAREVFEEMKETALSVDNLLIESQEGAEVSRRLGMMAALEAEHRALLRANSRIIEHLLPQAEIAELSRGADHLTVKARAVREAASERIQRTAQLMAEAAEYEGGIVFDSVNTLSGELHRQASEFDRQAGNYHTWAREREEQHLKLAKELESLGSIR
jgi:hypothetical protein